MKKRKRDGAAGPAALAQNGTGSQENMHQVFAQQIPDFFEDRLDEPELRRFLQHYDDCAECRDELSIQFLVQEALVRLESGRPFNLQKETDELLGLERRRLAQRERLSKLTVRAEIVTLACFAAAVVFVITQIGLMP